MAEDTASESTLHSSACRDDLVKPETNQELGASQWGEILENIIRLCLEDKALPEADGVSTVEEKDEIKIPALDGTEEIPEKAVKAEATPASGSC